MKLANHVSVTSSMSKPSKELLVRIESRDHMRFRIEEKIVDVAREDTLDLTDDSSKTVCTQPTFRLQEDENLAEHE